MREVSGGVGPGQRDGGVKEPGLERLNTGVYWANIYVQEGMGGVEVKKGDWYAVVSEFAQGNIRS